MKARLIYYPARSESESTWGSLHRDYSLITVVTSPMFFDENWNIIPDQGSDLVAMD
jgi:hypothetical protein